MKKNLAWILLIGVFLIAGRQIMTAIKARIAKLKGTPPAVTPPAEQNGA